MRVSVVQMSPGHDKADNLVQAARLIDAACAADQPDLIALPEVWTCLGGDHAAKLAAAETLPGASGVVEPGSAYAFLQETARRRGIFVHGGSILERAAERLHNTTLAFDPDGRELARYRKIHLFDITTPDGTVYGESRTFEAGQRIVTYEACGIRVGCTICYDLRFPELFLALRRAGAELILVPAAFTLQTGRDHWEPLLRARAIETQCWIAAPATCGRFADAKGEARFTYGHSLVCDPWGLMVARASDGPGWTTARLDATLTERIRRDMPVLDHRRLA